MRFSIEYCERCKGATEQIRASHTETLDEMICLRCRALTFPSRYVMVD